MKFEQIVTGLEYQNHIRKPWYLGYSYRHFEMDLTVYHIVPINFIIRFFRHIGWLWNRCTKSPSKIDKYIQEESQKAWNDARVSYYKDFDRKVEERAKLIFELAGGNN